MTKRSISVADVRSLMKTAWPSKPAKFARGRHRPKTEGMNKLEAAYNAQLWLRHTAGDVLWFVYEGVKLRLADNTFYTPDFAVMLADGTLEMHETKGFWEEDARAKIKVAASLFPFRFVGVTRAPAREGGGFRFEEF